MSRLFLYFKRHLARLRNNIRRFGIRYPLLQIANALLFLLALPRRLLRRIWRHVALPLARRMGISRALRVLVPTGRGVRRFINARLGMQRAFLELDRRGVTYIVLRWFENFPAWPENEDLDILVEDADLGKLSGILDAPANRFPVDLYSVSAKNGWNGLPYYPPQLARGMLARRMAWKGCFVPCPKDHFLSLCYHVVYHKAETSGLPVTARDWQDQEPKENRYTPLLQRLGAELGYSFVPCLAELRAILDREKWNPSLDTLRKLAARSPWLASLLPSSQMGLQDGELIVFVAREAVLRHELWDFVVERLGRRESGIDILWSGVLSPEQKTRAIELIRGGEWGRGPFPSSGGPPAAFIVAFDYHPVPVAAKRKLTHPYIQNERVFLKETVRDEINRLLPRHRWVNSIHSSDDEMEAWEYLDTVFEADFVDRLRAEVRRRREAYRTEQPVVELLHSNRTRGKVEIIKFNGHLAIRKTYKAGRERYAEREALAFRELSKKQPAVPPLLASGANYVVTPYYEDILRGKTDSQRRLYLRNYRERIVDFMRFLYNEGFFLIDFRPQSVLVTTEGDLRVVDFEFLYKYVKKPATFLQSYDIAGVPRDFRGDLPRGHRPMRSWRFQWKGIFRARDLRAAEARR